MLFVYESCLIFKSSHKGSLILRRTQHIFALEFCGLIATAYLSYLKKICIFTLPKLKYG